MNDPFFTATIDPDGGMSVRIDIDAVEAAGHAGIMLADFTNHFANALVQSGKSPDRGQAIEEMLTLFAAELQNPTDDPTGSLGG